MRLNIHSIRRGGAVLSAALLMVWPALYNRYPLLYPDSVAYVQDGPVVARALFLHKFADYFGMRSLIYSIGIFPFHWGINLSPVVALHAALTAYVLWLVVRSIVPRWTAICYFAVVAPLSLLTGLGWTVSLIMPDILGPLLYLCIYLLVFAPESLSRGERLTLIPIAWWAAASHVTHVILAAGMCVLLASLLVFGRRPNALRWKAVGGVAVIVLMALAAQFALNAYLYDRPSLDHEQPPFLTARVIADGPGRWYLERHCGNSELAVCDYVQNLPGSTDSFLWDENGIWQNASTEQQDLLRRQEMGFVMATLRVYPRQQLLISLHNFWRQLTTFDLSEDANDLFLDWTLPGAGYAQGRQAQQKLPEDLFTSVQSWTVIASIVLIGVLLPFAWRRLSPRLAGLGVVILFAIIANAFVTGVLSEVDGRYQSRVVWLLPLLAGGFVLEWIEQRSSKFAFKRLAGDVVLPVAAASAASLNT
jgi:hypothetical protein